MPAGFHPDADLDSLPVHQIIGKTRHQFVTKTRQFRAVLVTSESGKARQAKGFRLLTSFFTRWPTTSRLLIPKRLDSVSKRYIGYFCPNFARFSHDGPLARQWRGAAHVLKIRPGIIRCVNPGQAGISPRMARTVPPKYVVDGQDLVIRLRYSAAFSGLAYLVV
jgi:hypothetical protein